MADDDLDDDLDKGGGGGEELEAGDEGDQPKASKKKLILLIALPLLLVVGGVAAAYFLGYLQPLISMVTGGDKADAPPPAPAGGDKGGGHGKEAKKEGKDNKDSKDAKGGAGSLFYDLPEFIVNVNTGQRRTGLLKIRVSLELAKPDDTRQLEAVLPRVIDNFQTYLRELRVEDLKGSAGMYRLREELLIRVNLAIAPARINDVLFKEMLIQ